MQVWHCQTGKNYSSRFGLRRFKGEISDFLTKCRSGREFCQRAGGQKRRLSTARRHVDLKPQRHSCVSLAVTVRPFRSSPRRRGELPSSRKGLQPPRRSGLSQPSSRKGPNERAFADSEAGEAGRRTRSRARNLRPRPPAARGGHDETGVEIARTRPPASPRANARAPPLRTSPVLAAVPFAALPDSF